MTGSLEQVSHLTIREQQMVVKRATDDIIIIVIINIIIIIIIIIELSACKKNCLIGNNAGVFSIIIYGILIKQKINFIAPLI